MKKLLTTFGMILGFITVASAQTTAKPAEALTAKPAETFSARPVETITAKPAETSTTKPVTKEIPAADINTEKKKITDVTPVEVKVAPVADEMSVYTTDQGTKSKVATTPAKVVVEKPVTTDVKTVKAVPVEKAVEVKPAKTKN